MGADEAYVDRVRSEVAAEVERQQAKRTGDLLRDARLWQDGKGSVGAALRWFDEIAQANPFFTAGDVAAHLRKRVEQEIEDSPRFYTQSHLWGVVKIAEECAVGGGR